MSSALTLWLAVAAALLLVLLAGLAAALGWAAHAMRRLRATEKAVREARREIDSTRSELAMVRADVARLDAHAERVTSRLVTAEAQIATERVRSDRILDVLSALPPTDVVISQDFLPAADSGNG